MKVGVSVYQLLRGSDRFNQAFQRWQAVGDAGIYHVSILYYHLVVPCVTSPFHQMLESPFPHISLLKALLNRPCYVVDPV